MKLITVTIALAAVVVTCVAAGPTAAPSPEAVLDDFHDAASKADGEEYFALFSHDAVFFGTDATERWPIEEFRRYAMARFETGRGWTYRATGRHVFVADEGATAWFDERLHNDKYGECRGTGVLVKRMGVWRIAQYNLTIPIPNEIALDVVRMIRTAGSGP